MSECTTAHINQTSRSTRGANSSTSKVISMASVHQFMLRTSSAGSDSSAIGLKPAWEDEMGQGADELLMVSTYSNFEKLAHGPRGTQAKHSIHVYRFQPSDGSMVLLNKFGNPNDVLNPAFTHYHPRLNVAYTCTEDIENNGQIFAFCVGPNGELTQMGQIDAGGTSTCYITIDRAQKHLLVVNYWDSTLVVIPIDQDTGNFCGTISSKYDPKKGAGMKAAAKKHGGVNHSNNDDSTIRQRQADPHSHALELDPFVGTIAYVPDLGKDLVREFYYDKVQGKIELELNVIPSGLSSGKPDGPRYIEFHPEFNVAYVINELSSTVAVFSVDRVLLNEIAAAASRNEDMTRFKGRTTLTLIQTISCLPAAYPTHLNTCGRICVHKSGRFVVVSNRGHESLAILRVKTKGNDKGKLKAVGYFHTRGETPRHFQFDSSGQFLIVANQDSDSIAVFSFNLSTGQMKFTGNEYHVPSPNFVGSCPIYQEDESFSTPIVSADIKRLEFNTHAGAESDSESSDNSTVPVKSAFYEMNKGDFLREELVKAREEIELLKKQLQSLQTS